MVNSRDKGARGERQWRDEIRAAGWKAERGQQRSGSPDSPDVKHDMPFPFHFEVKRTERFQLYDALEQAAGDCHNKFGEQRENLGYGLAAVSPARQVPTVAHKRNGKRWVVCMYADDFFDLVREAK